MKKSFEAKFGKYAIKNLSLVLVLCYAIGYLVERLLPNLLFYLQLNPYEIIHHFQIWRLFTWILIPPNTFSFWTLIILYFYYSIGTSLEIAWGTYRYNVYLFSGFFFTIIGAFLLYAFSCIRGTVLLWDTLSLSRYSYAMAFSTYYVNMSIFLAYAATFSETVVYVMMLIPIKVKYLGIIYGAIIVYEFLTFAQAGELYLSMCVAIVASLLNFLIYFATSRKTILRNNKIARARMQSFTAATQGQGKTVQRENTQSFKPRNKVTRHKCAMCGATEETNPEKQFRFCSKCNGNYEYCEDHIFTHIHVQ